MSRAENTFFGIAFTCTCLLAGCTAGSRTLAPNNSPSAANPSPIVVHVFEAQPSARASAGDLLIPAALSVEDTAMVLAEREGRIVNLRGQEGQRVKKGDVLAQFKDDDQRSQLQQAEIEVSRLQVEEQQYDALVKLNRSELERESSLASQGVSSKADVERAQYKLDQSVKEYEKTQLATASARARVEAVKLELEKSTVRAPITGIITHRYTALGTNLARNDKLFEVAKLTPLEIKFQLPQTEKERLSPGRIVNLSRVDSDRLIARARIRRVDPVADATSSTFGYLADIVGGSGLMPGLAVNVHIPRAAGGVSFWIPRAAFPAGADPRSGAQSTLLVVDGDKCSMRIVGVNAIEGDQLEVITGLAPGDRVILAPPADLKQGDKVEVKQA
jgi:RND family efflux transporter MFP subunit